MGDHGMGMAMALFMEAFVSIHMSVFVLLPLSKMISRENSKKSSGYYSGSESRYYYALIFSSLQESQWWISLPYLWERSL